jgi:hypothetical protein
VLKATNIAMNETARKWAAVSNTVAGNIMSTWRNVTTGLPLTSENLDTNDDRVTVVIPLQGANQRVLVNSGGNFSTTAPDPAAVPSGGFYPTLNSYETYIIYGIKDPGSPVVNPLMPFNRADYYVRRPATMPTHCAPQTGVLFKATLNHDNGRVTVDAAGNPTEHPLLDCVGAMKIVLMVDADNNPATPPTPVTAGAWLPVPTAADIRTQLKEVRIYIVTHEGQRDPNFTFPTASLTVTDSNFGALLTYPLPDLNYRWKVYTMSLKPYNLR